MAEELGNPDRLRPYVWLTPAEVCAAFPFSDRQLKDWRTRGVGPPFWRFSTTMVRYRKDLLEAWVADRKIQTQTDV